MKKRVTACLTALCLAATTVGAAVALTACSKADIEVYLLANTAEGKFYEKYFKELGKELGIKIGFDSNEKGEYYNTLQTKSTNQAMPDIFYVRPNEVMVYANYMQSLQSFADEHKKEVDALIPAAIDLYKYNPTTKKMDAENGEIYAFPKDLSTQQLGYNKNVVELYTQDIHDMSLPLPWELGTGSYANKKTYTWKEYEDICKMISNTKKTASDNIEHEFVGCDVPDIEIILKSINPEAELLKDKEVQLGTEDVNKAIEIQKSLSASGAAKSKKAKYEDFVAGRVAFYGQCGSWEIRDYDDYFSVGFDEKERTDDGWGVMPWPTTDGGANWYGKIMSAGYAVSKDCAMPDKAMEIVYRFMTQKVQERLVATEKLSLPMIKTMAESYVKSEYDDTYSPKSRGVFIDVINGTHGFLPIEYSTYNNMWLEEMNGELKKMWDATNVTAAWDELRESDNSYSTLKTAIQKYYSNNEGNKIR